MEMNDGANKREGFNNGEVGEIPATRVDPVESGVTCDGIPKSKIPSNPIVQSVDINTKSTSYAKAAGASAKDQPKVNSNFRTLVADPVFNGVNISILRKVVKKEQLGETWAEKDNDEFQRLLYLLI
nr:zinc knuckle CX2CX4HX4C [Tanacetum cinerariifolium]